MSEGPSDPNEPRNAFELFSPSFGFLGLIGGWTLFYFFIFVPWEATKNHEAHVFYSVTAIGITTGVCLWTIALLVGGGQGSRLITDFTPSQFSWRQTIFVFVWAIATFSIMVLLQQHLQRRGYST